MTAKRRIYIIEGFFFTLILASILMLLYPIIANMIADKARSAATAHYDQRVARLSREHRKAELALARQYNRWLYQAQSGQVTMKKPVNYQKALADDEVMGELSIPAINIKSMPFFHGTSAATLDKGLGHLATSSLPVGGNNTRAVITGHTGVENQKLFSDLNKLRRGDVFYISVLGKKLMYKIKRREVVKPTDTDKVRIQANRDEVTLLTCTPPGLNTNRLLITGERAAYVPVKKLHVIKRDFWSYEHIVMMLFAVLIVGILTDRYWRKWRKHGQKENV